MLKRLDRKGGKGCGAVKASKGMLNLRKASIHIQPKIPSDTIKRLCVVAL